jgi:hypothetical protein
MMEFLINLFLFGILTIVCVFVAIKLLRGLNNFFDEFTRNG